MNRLAKGLLAGSILGIQILTASCGDDFNIIAVDQCESQSQVQQPALVFSGLNWQKEKVSVCWQNLSKEDEPFAEFVKEQVTKYWDSQIELDFVGWGRCGLFKGADIKIKVADERCWSSIGITSVISPTSMVLNFSFKKFAPVCSESVESLYYCIGNSAVHEFGHALGLEHEQDRPDTPEACAESVERNEFFRGNRAYGEWDEKSVMNYCSGASTPSCKDIAAVKHLYGSESDNTAKLILGQ